MTAVKTGDTEAVQRLLYLPGMNKTVLIDFEDSGKNTSLMWAAHKGFINIVSILLVNGADPEHFNSEKCNCYSLLGEKLIAAAKAGDTVGIQVILALPKLDKKRLVNFLGLKENTPLMWAAHGGHIEAVTILLLHGANVKLQNCYQDTALTRAADKGHIKVVSVLLNHRTDHEHVNRYGRSCYTFLERRIVTAAQTDNTGAILEILELPEINKTRLIAKIPTLLLVKMLELEPIQKQDVTSRILLKELLERLRHANLQDRTQFYQLIVKHPNVRAVFYEVLPTIDEESQRDIIKYLYTVISSEKRHSYNYYMDAQRDVIVSCGLHASRLHLHVQAASWEDLEISICGYKPKESRDYDTISEKVNVFTNKNYLGNGIERRNRSLQLLLQFDFQKIKNDYEASLGIFTIFLTFYMLFIASQQSKAIIKAIEKLEQDKDNTFQPLYEAIFTCRNSTDWHSNYNGRMCSIFNKYDKLQPIFSEGAQGSLDDPERVFNVVAAC